jgi:ankyrin repeat protein
MTGAGSAAGQGQPAAGRRARGELNPHPGEGSAMTERQRVDLDQLAADFCVASVADRKGRAVRMLAETPELASWSLATALVLGDVTRVRATVELDPAAAVRPDPVTGWTPLHAVCASRWHRLDPGRAAGLLAIARLLLDAGADPNALIGPHRRSAGSSPLHCAAASASAGFGNEAITRLLLERGAAVRDDDLYLAAFGGDDHACLRAMLAYGGAAAAEIALSAPISCGEVLGTRLLLEAGADPGRFAAEPGQPSSVVYFAVESGCPAELIALLIDHGADPRLPGPSDRPPAWLAAIKGRDDLLRLLDRHDAAVVPDTARFVSACMRGDRAAVAAMTAGDPGVAGNLADDELAALVHAAEAGRVSAVALMLDLGFPVDVRRNDDGATALHAAAYAGSTDVVRLLLDKGADAEALDGQYQSSPLAWAVVGSGHRPATTPQPDWVATARILLESGASARDISLSSDDTKPPGPDVAALLRAHGVGSG